MACVELAAAALKPELGVSARTFTKSASHARALADYGHVGARSTAEIAASLDPAADDYGDQVTGLIEQLDLDRALYRRREGRARPSEPGLQVASAVEALPFPLYSCDTDGTVTYFNAACVTLYGRSPQIGVDRWHVAWRIHTISGERVPFHRCAMALALRERRQLCSPGVVERPYGSGVRVETTSTPIFGPDGELVGGVNMALERLRSPTPARRQKA